MMAVGLGKIKITDSIQMEKIKVVVPMSHADVSTGASVILDGPVDMNISVPIVEKLDTVSLTAGKQPWTMTNTSANPPVNKEGTTACTMISLTRKTEPSTTFKPLIFIVSISKFTV